MSFMGAIDAVFSTAAFPELSDPSALLVALTLPIATFGVFESLHGRLFNDWLAYRHQHKELMSVMGQTSSKEIVLNLYGSLTDDIARVRRRLQRGQNLLYVLVVGVVLRFLWPFLASVSDALIWLSIISLCLLILQVSTTAETLRRLRQ